MEREVEYYMQAARILGFADYDAKHRVPFALTKQAHVFLAKETPSERKAVLSRAVRKVPVIEELLAIHRENDLDVEEVAEFLREITDPPLRRNTARRRATTIIRWLEWTRT